MSRALSAVQWSYIPHLVPYPVGLALQEHLVNRRLSARSFLSSQPSPSPSSSSSPASSSIQRAQRVSETDILLLLEHSPVFSEGRRKGAKEAVADESEGERLRGLGADYVVTQRGGLVTYHGPGQLVGYPIWDIAAMDLSTRCYVDKLQTAFKSLLNSAPYGIKTYPPFEDNTGVWTSPDHKILSIGIQVRQRITSHGFALNVEALPLLRWFEQIVACGIAGKKMSSIERELCLLRKEEEDTRPDREAADESQKRTERMSNGSQSEGEAQDNTRRRGPNTKAGAGAKAYINPVGAEIEPGLILGPESRTTVAATIPKVVRHLSETYSRTMEEASESLLKYEVDSVGRLQKVWLEDEEVKIS